MGLHQRRGQRQQRHVHEALPLHLRLQRRRSVYQVSSIQVSVSQKINLIWSGCNSNVYCIVCPAFVLINIDGPETNGPTVTGSVLMPRLRVFLGQCVHTRFLKRLHRKKIDHREKLSFRLTILNIKNTFSTKPKILLDRL